MYSVQQILNAVYDSTTGGLKIAGTISGSLTITGDLTVNGSFNFGDASTDILTIAGYIQGLAGGKKFVSIGNATSAQGLTGTDDLVVNSDLEIVGGYLYLPNNKYIIARNAAAGGNVNMFKVNASDEIDFGAVANVGQLNLPADAGAIVLCDMSVSATPAAATEESYAFAIDGNNMYKMYAEADHAGGIQNIQHHYAGAVGIGKMYMYQKDDVADDATVSLPDATSGFALISDNAEFGLFLVQNNGTVSMIANSTNVDDANTDGDLCLYDGGTGAVFKNRLGVAGEVRIFYFFN